MQRWLFALLGAFCVVSGPVRAQSTASIPYIAYMSPGDVPRYDNAFLQGLQEQGYILPGEISRYDDAFWKNLVKRGSFNGKRIRMEIRASAENFPDSASAIAAELVGLNVDL